MTPNTITTTKHALIELLESCEEIHAAALYGSVARGDNESHSDIDLLLICKGGYKRELYNTVYPLLSKQFDRLSLSIYSPREIDFLAKAKSLFLLHLKRESVLLFDHTCLLTGVLDSFEPKTSYADDFHKSLELFTPLEATVSGSPNNLHRLAYIYSLFRVYGVYLLAERGVFEFSKAKMAAWLRNIRPNQSSNIALLSELRVLNANFFSGGDLSVFSVQSIRKELPSLETCVFALGEIVGQRFDMTLRSYHDAVERFLNAAQSYSLRLGYRLRTWFLLLVYDGLNLFCQQSNIEELRSFCAERVSEFTSARFPHAIRAAAFESVEYLRNYPLKYFLLDESKIPLTRACDILIELSNTVDATGSGGPR